MSTESNTQCQAITGSNKQCKRSASCGQYCMTHSKKNKSSKTQGLRDINLESIIYHTHSPLMKNVPNCPACFKMI